MTTLRDDVVLIEHSDPGVRQAQLSTNTYAVLRKGRAFLIDPNFSPLMPFVRELVARDFKPAALVNSHRHVAGTGDAVRTLLAEFGPEAIQFPDYTSGHIALYGAENGGLMFAGDAAMGTTAGQAGSDDSEFRKRRIMAPLTCEQPTTGFA